MNQILPFLLESSSVRGRITFLDDLAKTILTRHQYPPVINRFLCELIALGVTLSNVFKFEGVFSLQIQGEESPVKFMIVDVTTDGNVRACANFDGEKLDQLLRELDEDNNHGASLQNEKPSKNFPSLPQLFGNGSLIFTVDQKEDTDRYQGVVELQGGSLAECLQHYFHQSEQLESAFFLSTTDDFKACCLMIQKLPFNQQEEDQEYDDWFRAVSILSTLKHHEVFFENLNSEKILHRLFWQENPRYFEAKSLHFQCRCSREKIDAVLVSISKEERQEIAVDGKITVTCDFCNEHYDFDA